MIKTFIIDELFHFGNLIIVKKDYNAPAQKECSTETQHGVINIHVEDLSQDCEYHGAHNILDVVTLFGSEKYADFNSVGETKTCKEAQRLSKESDANFNTDHEENLSSKEAKPDKNPTS